MNKYPKVNYIGNKERIADWVIDNFPISSGTVIDLFSGGCSIAYRLKNRGFKVITNDVLYSNFCIGKAIIENNNTILSLKINDENIWKYYDDKIYKNIKWMENVLYFPYEIKELTCLLNYSFGLKSIEKYIFLALLRRAMIRKIPYSRMNIKWREIVKLRDEEYSYLKYKRRRAYHNKSFLYHIYDNLDSYNNSVFDNGHDNKCYQKDAFNLIQSLKEPVDLIYIDPPYPSTMNKYNEFYGSYDKMLNKNKKYTDFTDKSKFLENIKKLISKSKGLSKYIVISLNNKSKPSYKEISEFLKKEVSEISVTKKDYIYKVTGKENKQSNYEILISIKL